MPNKKFSYENYEKRRGRPIATRKSFFSSDVEWSGYARNGFYWLQYSMPVETKPVPVLFGYKFHIGVDDSEGKEDNLARAWNLMKDIMIKYSIMRCKVVVPEGHFSTNDDERQYGKQITIYATEDPRRGDVRFWQDVLQEIESTFIANNIEPDPSTDRNNDLAVRGSQYIRYRNDAKIHEDSLPYVHCLKHIYSLMQSNSEEDCLRLFPGIVNMPIQYLPIEISLTEINELFKQGIEGKPVTEETLSAAIITLPKFVIGEMNAIANQETEIFTYSAEHNRTLCDPLQDITLSANPGAVATTSSTSCIASMLSCCFNPKKPSTSGPSGNNLREELLRENQGNVLRRGPEDIVHVKSSSKSTSHLDEEKKPSRVSSPRMNRI